MTARTRRRTVGILAAAVFAALAGPFSAPVSSSPLSHREVSIESSLEGSAESALTGWSPSVSDDGRFVAFVGPTSDDRSTTVYLRDREWNLLVELTVPDSSIRSGDSVAPVVSADGCTVTVVTEMAYDLFRDDDRNARWDVYRTTLPHCGGTVGEWELVSNTGRGAVDGVDPGQPPAVSASGQVVAFVVPDDRDTPTHGRLAVVDLTVPVGEPGRFVWVPGLPDRAPTGPHTYVGQIEPSMSADGTLLAFTTDALPEPDGTRSWSRGPEPGGPARTEVAVWSRAEPLALPEVISAGPSGTGRADQPDLSDDGRVVAFRSTAPDLVDAVLPPCGETGCAIGQVYARRLAAPEADEASADEPVPEPEPDVLLVSARPDGDGQVVAGTGTSSQPSVSGDGSMVVFVSRASGLVPGAVSVPGEQADGELLLADMVGGTLERLATRPDGSAPSTGASSSPQITANGRTVVFETSIAGQLVEGGEQVIGRQVALVTSTPTLTMPALDMGTVPVNWPSPEWFVTLTNEGPGAFVPAEAVTADPAFMITGGTCVPLVPLHPGASCTVNVVFTPIAEGPARTTLTVSEAGFGAASISTTIDGAGGEPTLSARPAGIDAGEITVGRESQRFVVELTNTGFAGASVSGVEVFGEHAADFEVVADRCLGRGLGPTQSCAVEVVARPAAAGARSALLTFTTTTGQRTSVVLTVRGRHQPVVFLPGPVVAGGPMALMGLGFPPSTPVVVTIGDQSRAVTVQTGPAGELDVRITVPRAVRPGDRVITVVSVGERFEPVGGTVRVLPAPRGGGRLTPALRAGG